MKRNVLLLEPDYRNKYPPIGLMKLATYHRSLNDSVVFYKGNLKKLILENLYKELLAKIKKIDRSIAWEDNKGDIIEYMSTGRKRLLEELIRDTTFKPLVERCFVYYKDYYKKAQYKDNPQWDRICITTLFTFHWKKTIEIINFAKFLVKDIKELWVGGIMASVIPDEIEEATGIKPWRGLLDRPWILDQDNDSIIDDLPLDYSILEEIDYRYPAPKGYYSYTTRGCTRKCYFCAVPQIEPVFKHYISLSDKIEATQKQFGEQRNLLLLDNNVLASNCFPKIIEEIKSCGFQRDSKFIEPNELEISIGHLKTGLNDRAYIRKSVNLLNKLLDQLKGVQQQELYDLLEKQKLLTIETAKKENILETYQLVSGLHEKYRSKRPKKRYVDFNQGVDARLINEEKMKLLSEIAINPLRIAFDNMKYEKTYIEAVKLAAKHDIKRLSNYLLYNEKDKPEELYQRLKINIELSDELKIDIYSFPMKFHPIYGEKRFNRGYLGRHWNRKFIRAIQTILNATKGKVGRAKEFFYKAFGKDEYEYFKLLYMPEAYILYRYFFEDIGLTDKWWGEFCDLSASELKSAKEIIEKNDFKQISSLTSNKKVLSALEHYTITKESLTDNYAKMHKEKETYDRERPIHPGIGAIPGVAGDRQWGRVNPAQKNTA
ncbi:MAG: hypothetical protein KAW12_03845 [Candidatus Aminicenantes bacterium]|nr:hypothetical protein [Candidatus Aminicenantes bacterium]